MEIELESSHFETFLCFQKLVLRGMCSICFEPWQPLMSSGRKFQGGLVGVVDRRPPNERMTLTERRKRRELELFPQA